MERSRMLQNRGKSFRRLGSERETEAAKNRAAEAAVLARSRHPTSSESTAIGKFSPRKYMRNGKDVDGVEFRDEDSDDEVALECLHEKSSSNSAQEVSGEQRKEASFSLGVGFALIYLMATSKIELSKQIETLLQNVKRQHQNEVAGTNIETSQTSSKAQEVSEYAITDHGSLQEDSSHAIIEHVSLQDCPSSSWEQEYSGSDITSSSCNGKMNREGKMVEMDQLEAELEAELQNLQLQLDTEVMLIYPDKNHGKYYMIVVEDSAPEESQITNFGEVFEQPEIGNLEYYHGVSPRELERRLHELQEVRQEERIRELESALEFAIHKLNENQRELSWWKDTGRVVFHRIPLRCRSMR
ncbi:protein POLAR LOCALIZATION DURING ASYMMETRIC DIVISION AND REDISTRIBUTION [Coffea eugenioides]|uniref:protein POLAR LOCALIZATION DURING ASYMMETRIC DIVISION AND REDISTRIBUTION n=1 Tax=Coffea eugenioides TaxID=49369 RepID=UPI000F60EC18|nr:protein POLAR LOCALIZATION DURING ASYMMETRIC DIVISION AND REDISTRIBUTION [Coffea eugenioides]